MTNEEAIKLLLQMKDGIIHVFDHDRKVALEKAIEALNRSKIPNSCHDGDKDINVPSNDCEYCHEDADGYVTPLERNGHAFIHFGMNGWVLSLKGGGWHGECKIRYCPMCGKELKHE